MDLLYAFALIPLDSEVSLYVLFFALLVLSGVGLPIPEEVTLVVGGYLAYLGFVHFWPTYYILLAGIVAADIMGYMLGKHMGRWVFEKIQRWKPGEHLLKKAEDHFARHSEKVVLFSRALMGIRVVVPMLAGHFGMKFEKFIFYDTIVAIPWVFVLMSMSYYFGLGLDFLLEVQEIKIVIFAATGLFMLFFVAKRLWRHKDKSRYLTAGH